MDRTEAFAEILFAIDAIMRPGTDATPVIKAIGAYRDIIVTQERETCAMKVIEVSQELSKHLRPMAEANDLRYGLDHLFVALAMYIGGTIDSWPPAGASPAPTAAD